MQKNLNIKHAAIQKERDAWELDRQKIKDMVNMESEVVALNVGGTHQMMTERDILRQVPGSTLEKMFNGMHELKKIDEKVFLDRDGRTFQYLVNYLRNDRQVLPEFTDHNDEIHFFKELEYWKIPTKQHTPKPSYASQPPQQQYPQTSRSSGHFSNRKSSRTGGEVSPLRERYRPPAPQTPLQDEYSVRTDSHGVALKAAKDKWNELGPLKLEEIVSNSGEPIDQTLTFGQSHNNKYIIGQLGANGKVTGVGKEINHIIYEG